MVKLPFELKDIKRGEFSYITKRLLPDKEGVEKGEMFLWKRPGDAEHSFAMTCPYCLADGNGTIELKKRPYRVRCPSCNKSITLKKLKNEK